MVDTPDFNGDWYRRYFPEYLGGGLEFVWGFRVSGHTSSGMAYFDELAGPHGVVFTLFPKKGASKEEIKTAKAELRHNRDVVGLSIIELT